MVWFWKKKDEQERQDEFSDLPPLPPMPEDGGGFPPIDMPEDQGAPPLPPLPELPPLPGRQQSQSQMQLQMAPPMPYPSLPPLPPMQQGQQPAASEQATATVFVRLDKYKDIMRTIENLQLRLDDLQRSLSKISSIKQKESEIMQGWGALMTESREKIDQLNQKLLKPGEA